MGESKKSKSKDLGFFICVRSSQSELVGTNINVPLANELTSLCFYAIIVQRKVVDAMNDHDKAMKIIYNVGFVGDYFYIKNTVCALINYYEAVRT